MYPFFLLFLLMGGVFAAIFSLAAQARRNAARAAKTDPEATNTSPVQTVQPAARQKNAAPAVPQPTIKPRVQTESRMDPTGIYRETYAKKPVEQPKKSAPKPPEQAAAASNRTPLAQPSALSFTGSDALRGVLYAEILGKPKALQ